MKYALKEWNTTVEALGTGKVIAIWRKGGIDDKPTIREPYESFNVEQEHFVIFPTFIHQHIDKIKREYWYLLEQSKGPNKDNQIKVKYWAEVEEVIEIQTLEQLLCISNELINTNENLVSSWDLYPEYKGEVLLLRIYKLTNPILVPYSQDYSSNKSWVELKIDIPKIGSTPSLSFKEFNTKARFIKALVQQPTVPEKLLAS